jgi:hypothetical protein
MTVTAPPRTILDMLADPQLLGGLPAFRDLTSWVAWLTFIKAVYGLEMSAEDLARFRTHTGRQTPRPGGYPEAVAEVGVQSGKTRIAGVCADHAASTGEAGTHAVLIGQDHRGAMRTLLRYAREPYETIDAFQAEVRRATADTLEVGAGVHLSAYPCRPEAVRGLRACIVVVDELAFFQSTDGRPTDLEMLRVARGRVAMTGGKVIVLSSPYAASGALWELHRKHYGREDSSTLVWQASAQAMNPLLTPDYLARMAEDDPEAYRSEVLGEFRTGVAQLFDPDALDAVILRGERERPPESRGRHVAGGDAASGTGADAFTVAIAHGQMDGVAILDACRAWRPPFSPEAVLGEAAAFLKSYRCYEVEGDAYAPGFVSDGFRRHGIQYVRATRTRSEWYLELLPRVNAARVRLLDLPDLLRELRGLERLRGRGAARDRVDHRPGAHDDLANSAAIALVRASAPSGGGGTIRLWGA